MTAKTASRMSTLNPNAPLFLPASYLAAEDFSPEWWHLVQTCPAFRDYWLRERFDEMESDSLPPKVDEVDDLEFEDLLELELQNDDFVKDVEQPTGPESNGAVSDLEKSTSSILAGLNLNDLRAQQQRIWREPVKYHDKVSNRGPRSPRKGGNNQFRIQQPRP